MLEKHSIIIDTPDFDYSKYGAIELGSIHYTFDVDMQSTLYKFMKARLRRAPWKITITINDK